MLRLVAPAMLVLVASTSLPLPQGSGGVQASTSEADDPIIIHPVRQGESLRSIATDWFIDPANIARAQALNGVTDPDKVRVGFPLKLRTSWLKTVPVSAQIASWRGQVAVEKGDLPESIRLGLELAEGDRLQTGSNGFVTLQLPDGGLLALPSNSSIRIDRLRTIGLTGALDRNFQVEQGRAEARVAALAGNGARFLISTPVSVAAVRGTHYRVSFTPAEVKSTTEVLEGRVAVGRGAAATGGVLLTPGFGVVATRNGIGEAEALLPAPVFEGTERVQKGATVDVKLRPLPGDVLYRFELSTDADGMQKVAAIETDRPQASFAGVDSGTYHVHATGISKNGLWGRVGSFTIDRQLATLPQDSGRPKAGAPAKARAYKPRYHPDTAASLAGLVFNNSEQLIEQSREEGSSDSDTEMADDAVPTAGSSTPDMEALAGEPMAALLSVPRGGTSGWAPDWGGRSPFPAPAPVPGGDLGGPGDDDGDDGVIIITPPGDSGGGGLVPEPGTGPGTGPGGETPVEPVITLPVPEPASWLLMIGGFGCIGMALRRRRRMRDKTTA